MTKIAESGWSRDPDCAIRQAINGFNLPSLGWQGFEDSDWVKELLQKYPLLFDISRKTSIINGVMLEELEGILALASLAERKLIQDFFVGKLALEELSCRMNGAGAGACDRRAAFMQIFYSLQKQ